MELDTVVKQQAARAGTHPDLGDEFPSLNVALDLVSVDERLGCLGLVLDRDALDEIGVPFRVGGEVEELLLGISNPCHRCSDG